MLIKRKLYWLIALATLVRCIIAVSVNLGNDEVYYLTYARHLQWNYFDHPPMVALLIRLTTFNLNFTNDFFVRLGPVILSAVNTYLVFTCAQKIRNAKAGFIAAVLFTASPYCSIIAGTFILPDTPQLFFWISSISFLIDIIQTLPGSKQVNQNILWFGLFSGLCIMSKIHGIFLWFGFGLYIIFYHRKLLANFNLYISVIITAVLVCPILIWNIQNNFITYTFHSDRVAIHSGLQADSFIREIAGGILYNNPVTYFLIVFAIIALINNTNFIRYHIRHLLLSLSLPLILLLFFISSFRDTLPHWTGPAYIPLILITACYINFKTETDFLIGRRLQQFTYIAGIFLLVIVLTGIMLINFMPGTMGKKDIVRLGDGDATLDMYGWQRVQKIFKKVYETDIKSGATSTSFIINNKWFPGAHIDNYIAQPLQFDFIALGELNDIHTYAWLNRYRKKLQTGDDAYFITASNSFSDPVMLYNTLFEKINNPVIIPQLRGGKPARNILIYLLKKYKGN
jgi:4-amino-4-deoxy-L-arabinose transferase-like glycosyltransferase